MNELTEALAKQAAEYAIEFAVKDQEQYIPKLMEKFAELIVRECIDTLLFHGCDDAVPYIEWMAKNKLGVKP